MPGYARSGVKQWVSFISRMSGIIELVFWSNFETNLFNHFKWLCSGLPKVIQNSELAISKN